MCCNSGTAHVNSYMKQVSGSGLDEDRRQCEADIIEIARAKTVAIHFLTRKSVSSAEIYKDPSLLPSKRLNRSTFHALKQSTSTTPQLCQSRRNLSLAHTQWLGE